MKKLKFSCIKKFHYCSFFLSCLIFFPKDFLSELELFDKQIFCDESHTKSKYNSKANQYNFTGDQNIHI